MFSARVKQAAEEGALVGIKIVVVLAIVTAALSVILGDYAIVRQRAMNGQQAFEFIQKMQTQQNAPGKGTP